MWIVTKSTNGGLPMFAAIRSWFRPVPRTRPFGEGLLCDGCDADGSLRGHANGGFYCSRCSEEVD